MKTQSKTNNRTVWVLITAVVAILSLYIFMVGIGTARAQGGNCLVKIAGICLGEFKAGVEEIQDFFAPSEEELALGSGVSLATDSFVEFGGIVHEYRSARFQTGTTTACSFVSPSATSTLLIAVARVDTASTSATTWAWYTSTGDPTATTTILGPISSFLATQGGEVYATATLTVSSGTGELLLPPS